MWIGAPSIPVVLLQASASLIASPQRLPLIARVCVSPERVLGRSSDSQVEMGGEMCEGRRHWSGWPRGPSGPALGTSGKCAGAARAPGTPRRGRCWRAVFRQNRTQQWRRSHRGCHAARVAHVWPAYGCGSYATSQPTEWPRSPGATLWAHSLHLRVWSRYRTKKIGAIGKIVQAHRKQGTLHTAEEARAC